MIADVPLGAFLSGGVDSSVVVAEMAFALVRSRSRRSRSASPTRATTSCPKARLIAERFGTDHHEFTVEPDAVELLPKLVRHYGEPYADSSAIPSFYLAEQTRRHVTVALNGDGGDESFAGYLRHAANAADGLASTTFRSALDQRDSPRAPPHRCSTPASGAAPGSTRVAI